MHPQFSVIIPHYNAFHLMGKCLQSLENQSFQDFEVLIVDDCSTDDSYQKLCDWASKSELNIRVFQQSSNKGPGAARNRGIEESNGAYITFIDADDFVEQDLFEQLLPYAQQNYDAVIFDAVQDTGTVSTPLQMMEKRNAVQGEVSNREAFVFVRGCTWGKAYRAAFLREHGLRFGEYYRSEDIPFTKSAMALGKKIFYLAKAFYHYVEVSTSIMHGGTWKPDEKNGIKTLQIIDTHIQNLGFEKELEAWKLRSIYPSDVFFMIKQNKSSAEIKAFIQQHFGREAMKNPYLQAFPCSRQMLMKAIATKSILVARGLYYLKYRE